MKKEREFVISPNLFYKAHMIPNNINIKLPINTIGEMDKDYMSYFIKSLPFAEYL